MRGSYDTCSNTDSEKKPLLIAHRRDDRQRISVSLAPHVERELRHCIALALACAVRADCVGRLSGFAPVKRRNRGNAARRRRAEIVCIRIGSQLFSHGERLTGRQRWQLEAGLVLGRRWPRRRRLAGLAILSAMQ